MEICPKCGGEFGKVAPHLRFCRGKENIIEKSVDNSIKYNEIDEIADDLMTANSTRERIKKENYNRLKRLGYA